MRFKSRSRALLGSALAASLGLAGLALSASPAMAVEDTATNRVAGATRYGTASAAAATGFPDGATNVVLASGEKFPDALAAGGLAGSLDAPILLTPTDALDSETVAGLEELGAENVTIVGGTDAVSQAVEDALEADGYTVDRVAGTDRFETAGDIAAEVGGTTAVLANGLRFPDALAISPGAHALELPVLLTTAGELSDEAAAYIDANDVDSVVIVGGTEVVSQAIEDELEADGVTVTRLAGATRYETAIEIADFHVDNGFSLDELVLATGEKFADALSGGPMASQLLAPMVLTQTDVLTPATETYIADNCQAIDTLYLLGGPAAIAEDVEDDAAAAAQCDSNLAFGVSPAGPIEATASTTAAPNQGAQTFSFSGVSGDDLAVALFPCDNVSANGQVISFADAESTGAGAGEADGIGTSSGVSAEIAQINGSAPDASGVDYTVSAVNGVVNVVVNSDFFDCTTVVLFNDADGDGELDLDANNLPTEPFGIAGPVLWLNPEAPTGEYPDGDILFFDVERNLIVLDDGYTYYYDSNDRFFYDHDFSITEAEWESYLSVGDYIDDEDFAYTQNESATSDFNTHDDTANAVSDHGKSRSAIA